MPILYEFSISERIFLAEIYFPKRAAYYGAIFDALRKGYDAGIVRKYLERNAAKILEEWKGYPALFDPRQYESDVHRKDRCTVEEAKERIAMYVSPFTGWSTYSVDGVFFGEGDRVFEEATQVVRIMVRFANTEAYTNLRTEAEEAGHSDVLRSILYWVISRIGRLDEETGWSEHERDLFLQNHTWTPKKRAFAKKQFVPIAKEAQRWVDDCYLFLISYLVRIFAEKVLAEKLYEEEIWVTSILTANLNIVRRVER